MSKTLLITDQKSNKLKMNLRGIGVIHLNKTGTCIVIGTCLILVIYLFFGKSAERIDESDVQINLKDLLVAGIKAAQNGGVEILAFKDKLDIQSKGMTKQGLNDLVTTADYQSHCAMEGTLKHFYSGVFVKSEESKVKCKAKQIIDFGEPEQVVFDGLTTSWVNQKDIVVWIDPLDATKEYTEQLYKYVTTMVCVAVRGEPVIGIIYKPFTKETSWAWVGHGKSSNLETKPRDSSSTIRFIVSRSHKGHIEQQIENQFSHNDFVVHTAAGSGYKVLELIAGNADAYLHNTEIKKWDICAGNALLNAVGGRMTTNKNNLIDYGDVINTVNGEGLIATVRNHEMFVGKL